jgi:hypothetical protein
MSFRKFSGLKYSAKHNSVSSYYNTSNNLQATIIGQPNTNIIVESNLTGNFTTNAAPSTPDNTRIQAAIEEAVDAAVKAALQAAIQDALKNWNPNSTFTLLSGVQITFDIKGMLGQDSYSSYIPTLSNIKSISLGNDVTGISDYAFQNLTSLESITIPTSVTSVGDSVFINVPKMTSITVESGNTNYSSKDGILFSQTTNKLCAYPAGKTQPSYTIQSGVKIISPYAFNGATKLISLTIPASVSTLGQNMCIYTSIQTITFLPDSKLTIIGAGSFLGATNLTSITIPSSVTSIGTNAFYGATSLTSITIPSSVTSIGPNAFYGTTRLTSINVSNTNFSSNFSSIGGVLFNKTTLFQYPAGNINTSYTIPVSVTSIGANAFLDTTSLTSITIPALVSSIDPTAFQNSGLTSVMFESSTYLTSLKINLNNNPQYFNGTTNKVTISVDTPLYPPIGIYPMNIPEPGIGQITLRYSGTTETFNTPENITQTTFQKLCDDNTISITEINSVSVGANVTTIGPYAFQGATILTSVKISSSVTLIDPWAFDSTPMLELITVDPNTYYSAVDGLLFNKNRSLLHTYPAGKPATSYTIPNSVTTIGTGSFAQSMNLTLLTIPNTVTTLSASMVFKASKLATINFDSGSTLLSIADSAFAYATNLTSINIPSTVTSIEDDAFSGASKLSSITVPNSVTRIGSAAFTNTGITSITIPGSVTIIGQNAFLGCKLSNVIFETPITIPASINGIDSNAFKGSELQNVIFNGESYFAVFNVDTGTGKNFLGATNVTISVLGRSTIFTLNDKSQQIIDISPDINQASYSGIPKNNIVKVYVGTGVSSIGLDGAYGAFQAAANLTEVTFAPGSNVKTIGPNAFYYATSLESIILPNTVQTIGNSAFGQAISLQSINIPASVTLIGDQAFTLGPNAVSSLTDINVDSSNNNYSSISGVLFDKKINTLIQYPNGNPQNSYIVPTTVTTIGTYAFQGQSSLLSITIPASVTYIDPSAFSASNITTVYSNNITYLESQGYSIGINPIFFGSNGPVTINVVGQYPTILTFPGFETKSIAAESGTLTVPIGMIPTIIFASVGTDVTSIGYQAFFQALDLQSIKISNTVIKIEANAFWETRVLRRVTFAKDSQLDSIGSAAFWLASYLRYIIIPSTVTSIGDDAFSSTRSLDWINIPKNVKSIGNGAFNGATSLTTVIFAPNLNPMTIGDYAFASTSKLQSITIPENVISIGNHAFSGSGLKTVIFESITNLTNLGFSTGPNQSFCEAMNVDIFGPAQPSTIFTILNTQTSNVSINISGTLKQNLYENYVSDLYYIVLVSIGTNVTSIDANAFLGVNNLRSITIPASVTSIGEFAFQFVNSLKTITFAKDSRLASIGDYAFMDAAGLTSIIIPASVTSIGDYAFNGASNLTTVTFLPGSLLTSIGDSAFSQAYKLTSITFAEDSILTSIGFNAFVGTTQLDSITIPASVTYIDSTAFQNSAISNVFFQSSTNLTSLGFKIGSVNSFCGSASPSVTISVLD